MRSKTHTQKSDTKEHALIPVSRHSTRTQSAMEYLMTYGWSILVIAIVLGVLYYLGVFNSANLVPKAHPGSCQVFRPNGPNTNQFIALEGTCTGEIPEYVTRFNGASSVIYYTPLTPALAPNEVTVSAWVMLSSTPSAYDRIVCVGSSYPYEDYYLEDSPGSPTLLNFEADVGNSLHPSPWTSSIATGTWYFLAGTYNGSYLEAYLDGVPLPDPTAISGALSSNVMGYFTLGNDCGAGNNFDGLIANVQIYNTSLSANAIAALYDEGIGGAPIDLQNLVGWWPLNGNAQDYSGNLNNGVPSSIAYSSSWTSGYTAP